jgi:hypothetical protein
MATGEEKSQRLGMEELTLFDSPEQLAVDQVGHTGQFPEGHPFRENPPKNEDGTDRFASTNLGEALKDELIVTPDTLEPLTETETDADTLDDTAQIQPDAEIFTASDKKQNRTKRLLIAAGVAIGAVVLAATTLMGGGSGKNVDAAPTPTTDEESVPTSESQVTTPSTTETTLIEEPNGVNGNIDLLEVPDGMGFVTATRLNGEEIKVPKLGGKTTKEVANSALALTACYLTTGSQDCLEAFSTNEDAQKSLIDWRELDFLPRPDLPDSSEVQVAIFDDPNDPAIFSSHKDDAGREVIELKSGTVYFGRVINHFGSNEWQHPDIREFGSLEWTVKSMSFYTRVDAEQGLTVVRFEIDLQPTEG